MKQVLHDLKTFLIPCAENDHRPGFFRKESVISIFAIAVLVWGGYFVQTKLVFLKTNFLAAVLPGVLTVLANEDRAANGIPGLLEDPALARAAQNKANDMAAKGYFSHVTPDGKTPWYWFDLVGYNYTYAGENLAVDFTDSKDVETAWMNSPTHRANIMKSQFTRVGIAVAQGTYQGKPVTFVVQFFATPSASAKSPTPLPKAPVKDVPANELATSAPVAVVISTVTTTPSSILGAEDVSSPTESPTVTSAPEPIQKTLSSRFMDFLDLVMTSPTYALQYVAGALVIIIAILLFLAIVIHIRIQYLEMIGGGLLLLAIAGGMFLFAGQSFLRVTVPPDTQPASVYVGFNP